MDRNHYWEFTGTTATATRLAREVTVLTGVFNTKTAIGHKIEEVKKWIM